MSNEKIYDLAQESLSRLADIMRNGEDRDSIRASEVLIDKALKLPKNESARKQANALTDDELIDIIAQNRDAPVARKRDTLLD